jgi:lysophospholipase L1-like esterase
VKSANFFEAAGRAVVRRLAVSCSILGRSILGQSLFVLALIATAAGSVSAQSTPGANAQRHRPSPWPTVVPQRRTGRNSETAHERLVQKAKGGVIDVYFVGDSITRRWGALDYPELLANWNENFFGWNAADFAWGGDRTENILWRLANGELDGVEPKVFVVQAGTNNLGDLDGDAAQIQSISAGIEAIVDACLRRVPQAVVVLTGVFPRRDVPSFNPIIRGINAELAKYAEADERIRFIDIDDRLADADGRLRESMSVDGLHPSLAGYQIWADALKPVLADVLGPPAERDLAPAPTGNPAAR